MDARQTEVMMKYAYAAHDRVAPEGTLAVWVDLFRKAEYETTMVAMREMLREPADYLPKPGAVLARAREIRIRGAAREKAASEIAARRVTHAPWKATMAFHETIKAAIKGVPLDDRADVAERACRAWLNERRMVTR